MFAAALTRDPAPAPSPAPAAVEAPAAAVGNGKPARCIMTPDATCRVRDVRRCNSSAPTAVAEATANRPQFETEMVPQLLDISDRRWYRRDTVRRERLRHAQGCGEVYILTVSTKFRYFSNGVATYPAVKRTHFPLPIPFFRVLDPESLVGGRAGGRRFVWCTARMKRGSNLVRDNPSLVAASSVPPPLSAPLFPAPPLPAPPFPAPPLAAPDPDPAPV